MEERTLITIQRTSAEPAPEHGRRGEVRRLVASDYSRQQIATAIHESMVEALHLRFGRLSEDERTWLHGWLVVVVPRVTESTVDALARHLDSALRDAPLELVERLEERRRLAALGVE